MFFLLCISRESNIYQDDKEKNPQRRICREDEMQLSRRDGVKCRENPSAKKSSEAEAVPCQRRHRTTSPSSPSSSPVGLVRWLCGVDLHLVELLSGV